MRSMVEGHRQVILPPNTRDHSRVPLHHFVVPLPVVGRNAFYPQIRHRYGSSGLPPGPPALEKIVRN